MSTTSHPATAFPDADAVRAIGRARGMDGFVWDSWRPALRATHLPPPMWKKLVEGADGRMWSLPNRTMTLIESVAIEDDGLVWHHVSIARRDRTPTWEELAAAKDVFMGNDVEAYVVFPVAAEYVNAIPHCLHVWRCLEARDGKVLPRFAAVINGVPTI